MQLTVAINRKCVWQDIENLKQMILRKPVVLSLEDQHDEAQFLTQYVIK